MDLPNLPIFKDLSNISNQFYEACINGDLQKASKLLHARERIDVKHLDTMFTLCRTVKNQHMEIVKLLLKIGANIHQKDLFWRTPLHFACDTNDTNSSIVKILLENGASVHAKDRYGDTPFHFACLQGNFEIVQMLLEFKADIHATAQFGKTPLHNACSKGNLEVLQELLKYQPNVNAIHTYGRNLTPLIEAALEGHTEIVKELLEHGADVDYIDFEYSYGNALHAAIACEDDSIVGTLLKNGCNTKVRARFIWDGEEIPNCTPFELALHVKSTDILKTIAFHEI